MYCRKYCAFSTNPHLKLMHRHFQSWVTWTGRRTLAPPRISNGPASSNASHKKHTIRMHTVRTEQSYDPASPRPAPNHLASKHVPTYRAQLAYQQVTSPWRPRPRMYGVVPGTLHHSPIHDSHMYHSCTYFLRSCDFRFSGCTHRVYSCT